MKKLWFKAKRYGWGWYPSSWEGWIVTLLYLLFFAVLFVRTNSYADSGNSYVTGYVVHIVLATAALILICYYKGEKPGWHWGDKDKHSDKN